MTVIPSKTLPRALASVRLPASIARPYRRSQGLTTAADHPAGGGQDTSLPSRQQRAISSTFSLGQLSNLMYKRQPFWQAVGRWSSVAEEDFLKQRWQTMNTIDKKPNLLSFLEESIPDVVPLPSSQASTRTQVTKSDFLADVEAGMKAASMSVRLTPYILSLVDWSDPANDPIRRQFIPLKSMMIDDHSRAQLDSLGEKDDSPVKNLVHRYPDKVLFLATSVCPVYCRFCTRSYAVGAPTETVTKASIRSGSRTVEAMFTYIEDHPAVQDVVVSGGDSYYLTPDQLTSIGERLLSIQHVRRIRIASKGPAVSPMRLVDPDDGWADALVALSAFARNIGKDIALHTHFNHQREITWITELAARRLFSAGVTVRNQTVLLRGVNDSIEEMSALIRALADLNIQPYYVYQGDMVSGMDDLRTPLSTILRLEKHIRGTIAGFMMPTFVVDLPGGGGKRPATSYESYDEETGVSKWTAPGVAGNRVFEYYDAAP